LTEEKEREKFEREYVAQHMSADALRSVESLRNGDTYDDEHIAESFKRWRERKQKRIGDIHIGGEILPEFKDDCCRYCGLKQVGGSYHLDGCPELGECA